MRTSDSITFKVIQIALLTAIASASLYIAINLRQPTDYSELPYLFCQSVIAGDNIEYTQCRVFDAEEVVTP